VELAVDGADWRSSSVGRTRVARSGKTGYVNQGTEARKAESCPTRIPDL